MFFNIYQWNWDGEGDCNWKTPTLHYHTKYVDQIKSHYIESYHVILSSCSEVPVDFNRSMARRRDMCLPRCVFLCDEKLPSLQRRIIALDTTQASDQWRQVCCVFFLMISIPNVRVQVQMVDGRYYDVQSSMKVFLNPYSLTVLSTHSLCILHMLIIVADKYTYHHKTEL